VAAAVLVPGLGAPSAHADVLDLIVDPIIAPLISALDTGTVAADTGGVGAMAAAADAAGSVDPLAGLDQVLVDVGNSIEQAINTPSVLGQDLFGASPADAAASSLTLQDSAEPAAGLPGLPNLPPQIPDSFLDLVQKWDGYAFTTNALGEFENYDIIGTIAMQINEDFLSNQILGSLGLNLVASQILAGDFYFTIFGIRIPVTTDFFEEFVTHEMNPDAFTSSGLPATPGDPIETIAYQLDNLLAGTVYANDLNAAALILWP